ncbi:YdcF family protein [Acidobacteria bacterium AH-259-A15]|nr:YdcF family protein [Acidobacteria bacterium AH-259-A15]
MASVVDFVENFLIPGSLWFLFCGFSGGLLLLYWRGWAEQWGRRWLTMLVGLYWLLSMPFVSSGLEAGLIRGYGSLANAGEARKAAAVVLLAGGGLTFSARGEAITILSPATAFRVLEGARVYSLLEDPWVIVSGGIKDRGSHLIPYEALREELIRAGVPAERILLESTSQNTREQAINMAPLLQRHQIERFVLVTSPTHMARAMATFEAIGLHPMPSVSGDSEEMAEHRWRYLPTAYALGASRWAIREYLALAYYWSRGWLTST